MLFKKNDTFNEIESDSTFFPQPLFLMEKQNKNDEVYLEYLNLIQKISPTEFEFSLKNKYDLNSYSNFILFNLKHNKDIDSINNLMKTIIYTLMETELKPLEDSKYDNTRKIKERLNSSVKKINIFLLNIVNEIYKDKFLSNSLNIENKLLSLSLIKDTDNFKRIETNFYCYNKLEETHNIKGKGNIYIKDLLESKEAIENEKVVKLILKNIDLKTDLFNLNNFLQNNHNKSLDNISDNYLLFHNKFINFLNDCQNIILNKNSDLYYFFSKNIHNINNDKLELSIRIAFENDFSNYDFFIDSIKYLKKNYTLPLLEELNNKDKELKDFVKKSLLDINYFVKNPFFMLSLFENNKNSYEELFYLINRNTKKQNLSIFSTSKESIKLNYENKNFNILKLDNNEKNRTFLKSYIYNLFENDFLSKFVTYNKKNNNIYHSLSIFLINNFSHLNEKFPNLLKEFIEEIDIENIIKENKSYIIEIIDSDILKDPFKTTEQKINDLSTPSNKEKYIDLFIKSIKYISDNYIDLNEDTNIESIIEIIKKKNKVH